MNSASTYLAAFVLLMFWVTAAVIYIGAERYAHWSKRRQVWTSGSVAAAGIVFACFTFVTDYHDRVTTLHEIVFEPEGQQNYRTEFDVESPGVRHNLIVAPLTGFARSAVEPVRLRIEIDTNDGEPVLDVECLFELRLRSGSRRGSTEYEWDYESIDFTPSHRGHHVLEITPIESGLPIVHVRVADPTKTDGHRAPGY